MGTDHKNLAFTIELPFPFLVVENPSFDTPAIKSLLFRSSLKWKRTCH